MVWLLGDEQEGCWLGVTVVVKPGGKRCGAVLVVSETLVVKGFYPVGCSMRCAEGFITRAR